MRLGREQLFYRHRITGRLVFNAIAFIRHFLWSEYFNDDDYITLTKGELRTFLKRVIIDIDKKYKEEELTKLRNK